MRVDLQDLAQVAQSVMLNALTSWLRSLALMKLANSFNFTPKDFEKQTDVA